MPDDNRKLKVMLIRLEYLSGLIQDIHDLDGRLRMGKRLDRLVKRYVKLQNEISDVLFEIKYRNVD